MLLLLAAVGCKTVYRDPKLEGPTVQPAILLHPDNKLMNEFLIERINGKWRGTGIIKRYELAPGEKTLEVAFNNGIYHSSRLFIRFEAKAGETYEFAGASNLKLFHGYWGAWVTELSTGKKFYGEPKRKQTAGGDTAQGDRSVQEEK